MWQRALILTLVLASALVHTTGADKPKLILAIVVDDLGHGDVGFTVGTDPSVQTYTPNMDALAQEGVVLNRHYVHQTCSPSRCSFLSGRLPMHVQVRVLVQLRLAR